MIEDVERIRNNSMVPSEIPIYGYIYDCKTGALVEIPEATDAGRVRYSLTMTGKVIGVSPSVHGTDA